MFNKFFWIPTILSVAGLLAGANSAFAQSRGGHSSGGHSSAGHSSGGHTSAGHSYGGHSSGGHNYGGHNYGGHGYGGHGYGGHGYGLVTATADQLSTEFVCIPRPFERSDRPDGGPLQYRVVHRTHLWKAGEAPKLEQEIIEGDVRYSV